MVYDYLNKAFSPFLSDVVVYAYNSSTWEAEARALQVQGGPGPHSKTLLKKTKTKKPQNKKTSSYDLLN
jgi:hypothetical protein